jgi:hypothetical protein
MVMTGQLPKFRVEFRTFDGAKTCFTDDEEFAVSIALVMMGNDKTLRNVVVSNNETHEIIARY